MKIRSNFVSNSSSSSFIVGEGFSYQQVCAIMEDFVKAAELLDVKFSSDDYFVAENYTPKYYEPWLSFEELKNLPDKFIVVESSEDNSIPYQLHDLIEDRLCAKRVHLG